MLLIEFHDFCRCAYEGITDLANQGDFVDGIFKAAGSSYAFSTSDRYSHSNYPTKMFNGGKPLSGKIRRSFSNPIDKKGVTAYLEKHIDSDKVRTVMNKFSLPGNTETSLTALSWALSEQLQIIIHEPDSHVDVVAAEYQHYLTKTADTLSAPFQPLCDGDFYEKITHEWVIRNMGKVRWTGRKLICTNHKQIPPRADTDSIDIPDTNPGETVTVAVAFDARGVEGRYGSIWAMVNAVGDDCFPGSNSTLKVTIMVINKAFCKDGGNTQ